MSNQQRFLREMQAKVAGASVVDQNETSFTLNIPCDQDQAWIKSTFPEGVVESVDIDSAKKRAKVRIRDITEMQG